MTRSTAARAIVTVLKALFLLGYCAHNTFALTLSDIDQFTRDYKLPQPDLSLTLINISYDQYYPYIHPYFHNPRFPQGKHDGLKAWKNFISGEDHQEPETSLPPGVEYPPTTNEEFKDAIGSLKKSDEAQLRQYIQERAAIDAASFAQFSPFDYFGVTINMKGIITNITGISDSLKSILLDIDVNQPAKAVVFERLKDSKHLLEIFCRDYASILSVTICASFYESIILSLTSYGLSQNWSKDSWQEAQKIVLAPEDITQMLRQGLRQEFWGFHFMPLMSIKPTIEALSKVLEQELPHQHGKIIDIHAYLNQSSNCLQSRLSSMHKDARASSDACSITKIKPRLTKGASPKKHLEEFAALSRDNELIVNQLLFRQQAANIVNQLKEALDSYELQYKKFLAHTQPI